MVRVAHRRRAGAATDDAAHVTRREGAALRGGDGVAQRLGATDLPERGEEYPGDPGVAQQCLDAGAGLRSGPGGGGAGLLGADAAVPPQGSGDGVSERDRLVGPAPWTAVGAGRLPLLGGGPVRRQDVGKLRPRPTGVRQLTVAQHLLADLDQRVGAALPGGPVVTDGVAAGERFQGAQERLAVLRRQQEAAAQRPVGVSS